MSPEETLVLMKFPPINTFLLASKANALTNAFVPFVVLVDPPNSPHNEVDASQ